MNPVGIDVSKGKSMIAVARPFGEVLAKPYEVRHTAIERRELANYLKSPDGETRVILEHTGRYYEPVAQTLHDAGVFCQPPMDTIRYQLKTMNRQYGLYTKNKTAMKNNLIALLDQTYPGANTTFSSPAREDGSQNG